MGKTSLYPAYRAEEIAYDRYGKDDPLKCGYTDIATPEQEECQNPCDILKDSTDLRNTRLAEKWMDVSFETTPSKIPQESNPQTKIRDNKVKDGDD